MAGRLGQANDLLRLYSLEDSDYKAYMADRLAEGWSEEGSDFAKPFRREADRLVAAGYDPEAVDEEDAS